MKQDFKKGLFQIYGETTLVIAKFGALFSYVNPHLQLSRITRVTKDLLIQKIIIHI